MFQPNQKVLVVDGSPHEEGVIEKVSTFGEVSGYSALNQDPAYFVRVPAWDNGQNGGRWLAGGSIQALAQ